MDTKVLKFKKGSKDLAQKNGLPKAFFNNPKYKSMSIDARYLYMILALKMMNTKKVDGDGNMYVVYSNKDLMDDMNCRAFTVDRLKKELVNHDLLVEEDMPSGQNNRLYPLQVKN